MGLFDWGKKKAGSVKDTGKKVIGTDDIKNNAVFIKDMATKLLNPKEAIKNARKETFLEAQKRLNITDIDIIKNYKNNVYSFYISLAFGLVCVGLLVSNLVNFNFMGILTSSSILAVCLAHSFKFSFRAFQLKHQKLCSVKDWASRSSEWFPSIK